MPGHACLHEHPAPTPPGADHPGGAGQDGQCLLTRSEPGCQQVLVDVEEGDETGVVHAVERRLGADHEAGPTGPVPDGRRRHLGGRRAEERRQLLSGPGHADPQRLQPGRVTDGAHHRPALTAPPTGELPAGVALGDGGAAAGAPGQLATGPAGQEPDAPGAVQHADHTAVGTVQLGVGRGHQPLREEPGARVVAGPVHQLDHRPPPALHGAVGGHEVASLGEGERRAGRDEYHRGSVAAPALEHDIDRGPRRGPLLPVRLVVGVEHHRRRQVLDRRPGGGPGPHGDATTATRGRPTVRQHRHRHTCRAQSGGQVLRAWPRGGDDQDPVGPGAAHQLQYQQGRVERRGQPHDGRAVAGQGGVEQRHRAAAGRRGCG